MDYYLPLTTWHCGCHEGTIASSILQKDDMTTLPRVFQYFLLAALLAGPWQFSTHAHNDEDHNDDHACQLCLHAVQFDAYLPAVTPRVPVIASRERLHAPVYKAPSTFHSRFHDTRAPPRS